MQTDIWKFLAPLAILAFLVAYTRLAKRMKIETRLLADMVAGGFVLSCSRLAPEMTENATAS